MTKKPPHKRPVNMVFQRPTLFPHLDVHGNVAFGLRVSKLQKDEIDARVSEALALVRLEGYERRRAHELSIPRATRAAVSRNRRLYGGLVVHLGLIVAVIGVSWAALSDRSTEATMASGEVVHARGYDLRFDRLSARDEPQRRVLVADLTVLDPGSGDVIVRLHPSLNLYPASSEPIGTPSIRIGTPFNGLVDLYASLVTVENGSRATFRFFVNPGIGLLWFGGLVMALGGLLAAWPGRRRSAGAPGPEPVIERREEVRV